MLTLREHGTNQALARGSVPPPTGRHSQLAALETAALLRSRR